MEKIEDIPGTEFELQADLVLIAGAFCIPEKRFD